ncbi:cadherin-related family member 5-like isoform X3 [Paralichthys olivaceus]|uniref:cadherin-related family member 5-like isoform X3 n=1 Tax=Paralichthys olivaceus TaxID=8255 RepID=UPI003750D626
MDGVQPHLTVRTSFILLLLSLLQMSSGNICSGPQSVQFNENNKVDDLVANITVQQGVTLEFTPPPNNAFKLRDNQLLAAIVFDHESEKSQVARITCTETASGFTFKISIVVLVDNVNDNAPVFAQSLYEVNVDEMSPVGTTVGKYAATDPDKPNQLFYSLTSESQNSFKLKSSTDPDLIISSPLDYDRVKNFKMVLYAQDTPLTASDNRTSFTATTTIMVTIIDADNRPPWFQPCTEHMIGATLICQSAGYTGSVVINEQENGALQLKPGPLYATDGDTGINEEITYSFLSGNDEQLFEINANTGNITMLKPARAVDTINLSVLAAQRRNSHQFASTAVTISVQVKSLHPPQFQKPLYEGVISSIGSMAMDGDKPLYIHATDADYNEVQNPFIVYTINGSSDFSIINGYLFMTKDLPATTLSLNVVATDESNDQSDTAQLIVQVKSVIIASGGYGPEDMAALGATLGVLLFVCLVVIAVLSLHMRKGKADWKKIYEVSVFRSSLGQSSGDLKKGVQYTNEAFQKDEDGGSTGSGGPDGGMSTEAIVKSSLPLHALLPDDTNDEKEVKPILTKERRIEEGYKAVWFKEDIDPNAKEEVVIIPDRREDDSDEEDEPGDKTPKVNVDDADLDSGLGVKMGDPPEDSDGDAMTSDL